MSKVVSTNDLIKLLQSIPSKNRELPVVVLADGNKKKEIANLYFGVQNGKDLNFTSIGEEPNCVVMRLKKTEDNVEAPVTADTSAESKQA